MPPQKQPEGFQVTDRRRFSESGELREGAEAAPAEEQPKPAPSPAGQGAAQPEAQPHAEAPKTPPAAASAAAQEAASSYAASGIGLRTMTFDRLVMSYAQTAMLQLGLLAADPAQPLEPDLYGARETIDALALIEEKTRGNLAPHEQQMLENALFELRMAWLEIDRREAKARPG
jgi:hypothetical protein